MVTASKSLTLLPSLVLTTLLYFGFTLQLSAQVNPINLDYTQAPVADIIVDIAQHFNLDISFNESYFKDEKLTIYTPNCSLKKALRNVLNDRAVEYKINNNQILLQKYQQIYGYIQDAQSGERLIGAHIYEEEYGYGAWSDEEGFYALKVPQETAALLGSYIGYKTGTKTLELNSLELNSKDKGDHPIIIALQPDESIETVIISAYSDTVITDLLRGKDILKTEINNLVATGGEPDIMQHLYSKAGVTTGPDGIGGLHVRGGLVDQNLFLLDGAPIYNPSHSFGLHSIFNTDLIQVAEFKTYGFDANEGGRTASTLNMHMLDGDMKKWQGQLSLSTLATGLMINGPIIKDRVSILVAGRRTHIDPLVKSQTRAEKEKDAYLGEVNFHFYDLYAKLNIKPNKHNKITFSAYQGKDFYSDETEDIYEEDNGYTSWYYYSDFYWGNRLAALKWNHIFNSQLTSSTHISYSDFVFKSYFYEDYIFEDFNSGEFIQNYGTSDFLSSIADLQLNQKFDYYHNNGQKTTTGIKLSRKYYSPGLYTQEYGTIEEREDGYIEDYIEDQLDNLYSSDDVTLYINSSKDLTSRSAINYGINGSSFRSYNRIYDESAHYYLWQANLKYIQRIKDNSNIHISIDRMNQPQHVISTSSIGFPNDLWVPSTSRIKPQTSIQINLGYTYQKNNLEFELNAYYKEMDNIIRYNYDANLPTLLEITTQQWESESVVGKGTAQGIECSLKTSQDKLKTQINYAYANSDRTFVALNEGQAFPFEFNLRHTLSANLLYQIKGQLWGYTNWNYRSGLYQTLYESAYLYTAIQNRYTDDLTQISDVNGDLEKPYHRLDMGIKWSTKTRHMNHSIDLGIQNIYGRKNNYFSYIVRDDAFPEFNGRESRAGLPLLPTLTYRGRF